MNGKHVTSEDVRPVFTAIKMRFKLKLIYIVKDIFIAPRVIQKRPLPSFNVYLQHSHNSVGMI